MAAPLISLTLLVCALLPAFAHASVLSDLVALLTGQPAEASSAAQKGGNLQTMPLLRPAMNIDPGAGRGGGDIMIVDNNALMPEEGPSGTLADIEKPKNGTVSRYVVRSGDTLSGIAKMFNVTPNTIRWANDIAKDSQLQVGEVLVVLPIPGIKVTVKKGDTLASLARRYGGDPTEIANYNQLDGGALTVGDEIVIPNGEAAQMQTTSKPSRTGFGPEPAHNVGPTGTSQQRGYYIAPLVSYVETQGVHGYNAVDLAAPVGTPILASATGDVVVAREGGWNGGYGSYVVIQHDNGSQTLYAHMSRVIVGDGQHVVQGQVIGYVGQTGKATGPHVHFEIRNGIKNPF